MKMKGKERNSRRSGKIPSGTGRETPSGWGAFKGPPPMKQEGMN